jgi:hypothetical protein
MYAGFDDVPESKPEKAAAKGRARFSRRGLQPSMFAPAQGTYPSLGRDSAPAYRLVRGEGRGVST